MRVSVLRLRQLRLLVKFENGSRSHWSLIFTLTTELHSALPNWGRFLRINPGNIGRKDRVQAVVSACKDKGIRFALGLMRVLWVKIY